jgi:hypothetical protein
MPYPIHWPEVIQSLDTTQQAAGSVAKQIITKKCSVKMTGFRDESQTQIFLV